MESGFPIQTVAQFYAYNGIIAIMTLFILEKQNYK